MARVQQVYQVQCDMQANPHLFSLPGVAFAPAKRIDIAGDHFHSFLASSSLNPRLGCRGLACFPAAHDS